MKIIENYDYILSVGAFFEDDKLKNSLQKALNNGANFIYMHPIDNFELKDFYAQFIKYEVASEEAILALIFNFFSKKLPKEQKDFLDNLDIGYLSAESSAGEEEFEEAFLKFEEASKKALLIGDDLIKHARVENIVKLLANIKKYIDFELIFCDKTFEEKVNSCSDLSLDEIDDLQTFNGALVYFTNIQNNEKLVASQTFLNIAKVKTADIVSFKIDNKIYKKEVVLDKNLLGTIALISEPTSNYRFVKIVLNKEQN
ncbi:hypothetical protein AN286_03695 [Aliarcobacter cryaerophilus ATCC 43158]|uniref:NADH:quinone oxidoreductase I, chain G-like protein n=1 Tax=Aliarcobacter cryaerophilus ATCC 43158 TaxID=1032070 RepID=A0AAD0TS18_9BACT|nr:hypothetical protein [Aliarcobacter cryaerophilus]AYJ79278.1 NADH:quinone oxidoreductase I, chain G-like protein [Aliarcobacter cryaerophilus ATCC 43158]PRM96132.1 hypothetical protein CJ667_08560 [Aliarcobacter cryaerophilus]QCZ23543.1 hypothetical protein AN286_03695 [Aliarcobacter cryaerophilus ATCC 43158]